MAPTHGEINREARLSKLAELWLDEITTEDRIAQQTIDNYRWALERTILPAVGELRLREATVSRLDRFFKTVAIHHPAKARIARTVLGQMLAMAVRHDALAANPVRDVGRLRKPRRTVRALAVPDLQQVRAAIRAWQQPAAPMPGLRRTPDLAHIVDILLATGGRIGEVLALRWDDIDLNTTPPRLTFAGTIVYVKGRGYHRQPWTKSDAGYRTLTLPRFAVHVLQQRQADAPTGGEAPVFPSRRGTWLSPHNVRRQWRQARQDTGLEWVTPHTFRKTVATLLDREANTRTAAAQLGHTSEEITSTYYVQKARALPAQKAQAPARRLRRSPRGASGPVRALE